MHKEQHEGHNRLSDLAPYKIISLQSESSTQVLCPYLGAQSTSFHKAMVFTLRSHSHVSESCSLGRHHLDGLQRNLSAVIGSAIMGTTAVSLSFCIPYARSLLHKQRSNFQEHNSHYLLQNSCHYPNAIITLTTKVAL